MFAFCTVIGIVLVFSTESVSDVPAGISANIVDVTLKKASATVGVTIALLVVIYSPPRAKEIEIGPAVSPSGTLIFPLNVI